MYCVDGEKIAPRFIGKSSEFETTKLDNFRVSISEMDHSKTSAEEQSIYRSEVERRFTKRNSFERTDEFHVTQDTTASSSSTIHYDDYGQKQQTVLIKCQRPYSGISGAFNSTFDVENNISSAKLSSAEAAASRNSCILKNGVRGKSIITATAPSHLRSCYSQENLRALMINKNSLMDRDNSYKFNENVIMNANLDGGWTNSKNQNLSKPNEYGTSMHFPCARFDSGGDIEMTTNFNMIPVYENHHGPDKLGHNTHTVGSRDNRSVNHSANEIINYERTSPGQAPMIITATYFHSSQDNSVPERRVRNRHRAGVEDRRYNDDGKGAENLGNSKDEYQLDATSEVYNSGETYLDSTLCSVFSQGSVNYDNSNYTISFLDDMINRDTRPISSTSFRPTISFLHDDYISDIDTSIDPKSISSKLPPRDISENITITTTSQTSPYLFPAIIPERRSSWFSAPWASLHTGTVSRLVKAVSCDSTSSIGLMENNCQNNRNTIRSPKDIDHLSNLQRVTKLAEYFEKGDVDHVGALKLYHARIYKRELEKICAENYGSVLTKAQYFDKPLISLPPRPQWKQGDEYKDGDQKYYLGSSNFNDGGISKIENLDFGSYHSVPRTLVSSPKSEIKDIAFTKAAFPATSEPNLNAGFNTDLPTVTLAGCNDQGAPARRKNRCSRRTSYVMATTASQKNIVMARDSSVTGCNERINGTPIASYPVSEDASSSERHQRINEEEMEIGSQLDIMSSPTTRISSSNTLEQTTKTLEPKGNASEDCGKRRARFQRRSEMPQQETPRLSRLQIPELMERRTSSGSSVSMTPTPTPSPTAGIKNARIQRFINFFSGDHSSLTRYADGCVAAPGSSTSLSSSYTRVSASSNQGIGTMDRRSRHSIGISVPFTMEGPLVHKQLISQIGGTRKRFTDRSWKDYWAILQGTTLYLCRERPTATNHAETEFTEDKPNFYELPEDTIRIDVESCIADIAYDYVKRKYVFRVTTQSQSEHLFQASDSETMIRWIEHLQRCSAHENEEGMSNSMALIIKKYEAQSQTVSPSVKQRRSAGVGGTRSPIMANSQRDSHVGMQCEHDGGKLSSASVAVAAVSSNKTHSVGVNSNSCDKGERTEKGDHTPGKIRKWRRVRKSGSCPVPSPRGSETGHNPDAMFGARLEDCPTSGDEDFVPLIVQLCIRVVESQGLDAVGVYRIPGNTAAVNSLISTLDKGFEHANFNDSRWRDVNVVSSLLKAYFRKLADPLLTDQLYEQFIEASRIDNHSQKLKKIRSLVETLPRINYETLRYLIFHLKRVVSHSGINKMEARNLALMFGPSLVRPCGDSNMATMVTHMSDQCKIVELLITYCDWIFSPASRNDNVVAPPPLPVSSDTNIVNTSFADMTDLLKRVKTTEEDLERTKESIVKSILTVRRGSKKVSKGKLSSHEQSLDTTATQPAAVSWSVDNPTGSYNGHHIHSTPPSQSHNIRKLTLISSSPFNERNIDEEIKSRQQRSTTLATSSKGVSTDSGRSNHENGHPHFNIDVGINTHTNNTVAAEEMRRRREDNIYAARRIFIAGIEGSSVLQQTPPVDTVAKMDLLAQHSRHLNVNPQSLEVLSPETREKIKRLQTDSQLLRSKGQWQIQQLKKVANERQRIEKAWEKAKQDYEQDDFLDNLAENPRVALAFMDASSNPYLPFPNADTLSTSSDYSTTSSNLLPYDNATGKRSLQIPQQQQHKLMSISCTGALPMSENSSDEPSPNSSHSTNLGQSALASSIYSTPTKSTPLEQQRHSVAVPPQATGYTNVIQTGFSSIASPHRFDQIAGSANQLYDRSRLKHVTPGTICHSKGDVDDWQVAGVQTSSANRGNNNETNITGNNRQSVYQGSKVWYEKSGDDGSNGATMVTSSRTLDVKGTQNNRNALDQNANNVAIRLKNGASCKENDVQEKRIRILAPVERGTSRISQKIKFRSKSSSAEKRKDNRRHTLTDMEAIKNVLFGSSSSRDRHNSVKEKKTSSASITAVANNQKSTGTASSSGNKQSRKGKLTTWLKESFRKSSPDLYEGGNLDNNGASDDIGTKTAT